jgi:hypothetical protein
MGRGVSVNLVGFAVCVAAALVAYGAPPASAPTTGGPAVTDPNAPLATRPGAINGLAALTGPERRVLETPHFVVVSAMPLDVDALAVAELEPAYARTWRWMVGAGLSPRAPSWRLEVALLAAPPVAERQATPAGADRGSTTQASAPTLDGLPQDAGGYYSRAANHIVVWDPHRAPALAKLDEDIRRLPPGQQFRLWKELDDLAKSLLKRAVRHEIAHAVQFNTGLFDSRGDAPLWLVEGLAHAFEADDSDGMDPLLAFHTDLQLTLSSRYASAADLPDLGELVSDNSRWDPQRDAPLGWAVTRYLWREHREPMRTFLAQRMARGAADRATPAERRAEFTRCFGPLDADFAAGVYARFSSGVYIGPEPTFERKPIKSQLDALPTAPTP